MDRDAAYWTTRNALVDACLATKGDWDIFPPAGDPVSAPPTAYSAALDALLAFDDASGGAPVL